MFAGFLLAFLFFFVLTGHCSARCNPPCQNGGSCNATASRCACPKAKSGLSCELPPAPKLQYLDEFAIVNGSLFNWDVYIGNSTSTIQQDSSVSLYNGNSTTSGAIWSKTRYQVTGYYPNPLTVSMYGVAIMSNGTNSRSKLAVVMAGSKSIYRSPIPSRNAVFGVDSRSYTGFAVVFDTVTGSVYATISTNSTKTQIGDISGALPSQCINNTADLLKGRFAFAVNVTNNYASVTIYNGENVTTCVEPTLLRTSDPLYGVPMVGVAACCGESQSSFANIAELAVYSVNRLNCGHSKLGDIDDKLLVKSGDYVGAFMPIYYYCPLKTQGAVGNTLMPNRTIVTTCLPYDNFVVNIKERMTCVARNDSICDPPCENGGICQADGTCKCSKPQQQWPNCRFDSNYLPPGLIAFYPLSIDTYYHAASKMLADHSGSFCETTAVIGETIMMSPNGKLCSKCPTEIANIYIGMYGDQYVDVTVNNWQTALAADPTATTFFMFIWAGSVGHQHLLIWKNTKSRSLGCLVVGYDRDGKLFVQYNSTSTPFFSQPMNTNFTITKAKGYQLLAVSYDHSQKRVSIWLPLINDTSRSTISLPNDFAPPGPAEGETFHIGRDSGLVITVPEALSGYTNIACFGVMKAKPTLNDSLQYADACYYEYGNDKIPGDYNSLHLSGGLEVDGTVALPDGTILDSSGPWNDALNDSNSEVFSMAVDAFLPLIKRSYAEAGYLSMGDIKITGFHAGSIISDYVVALRSLTSLTEEQIWVKVVEAITRLVTSGTSIGSVSVTQIRSASVSAEAKVIAKVDFTRPALPNVNIPASSQTSSRPGTSTSSGRISTKNMASSKRHCDWTFCAALVINSFLDIN